MFVDRVDCCVHVQVKLACARDMFVYRLDCCVHVQVKLVCARDMFVDRVDCCVHVQAQLVCDQDIMKDDQQLQQAIQKLKLRHFGSLQHVSQVILFDIFDCGL